jgi:hypothetical protein
MDAFFKDEMKKAEDAPKDKQLEVYRELCSLAVPCKITETRKLPKYSGRNWMPEAAKSAGLVGDDLQGLGSIFLCRDEPYALRSGYHDVFAEGIGKFFVGLIDCNCLLFSWPMSSVTELGISSWTFVEFVEKMKKKEFLHFFEAHVQHHHLNDKSVIWVPYGRAVAIVSLPTFAGEDSLAKQEKVQANYYMYHNFVSTILYGECNNESQFAALKEMADAMTTLPKPSAPLDVLISEAFKWLKTHAHNPVEELDIVTPFKAPREDQDSFDEDQPSTAEESQPPAEPAVVSDSPEVKDAY